MNLWVNLVGRWVSVWMQVYVLDKRNKFSKSSWPLKEPSFFRVVFIHCQSGLTAGPSGGVSAAGSNIYFFPVVSLDTSSRAWQTWRHSCLPPWPHSSDTANTNDYNTHKEAYNRCTRCKSWCCWLKTWWWNDATQPEYAPIYTSAAIWLVKCCRFPN